MSQSFRPTDLVHSVKVLTGTIGLLKKDTDVCQARYESSFASWAKSRSSIDLFEILQFELRQLIRTFFAEVDGTLFSARQLLLWAHERGEIELAVPEIALLREEAYRFDRKSQSAVVRSNFSSTLDTLLLTLTLLPRVFSASGPLDLSLDGWSQFQRLLGVRNSITHPREIRSLVIETDLVLKGLPAARSWYYSELMKAVPEPSLVSVLGVGR